jgi:hypothetical protein
MAHWLKFGDTKGKSDGCETGAGSSTDKARHPYAHLLEAEDVMDVLEKKRWELDLVGVSGRSPDYQCVLRGGDDLFARTGEYYDTVRVETNSEAAEAFHRANRLHLSFNMDVDKYDMDDCRLVCAQWVSRCQHFLGQVRDVDGVWDDAYLDGWDEDPALGVAYARGDRDLQARIDQIRNLRPRPLAH